jgi:putative tricarboxylic transport membrane protein
MKIGRDTGVGFFLLFVSVLLCYGALRLGTGKINDPGPGFFPFVAGLIIAALTLINIVSSRKKEHQNQRSGPLVTGRAALFLIILIGFGFVVEKLGFFVSAFFTTLIMLRSNGIKKWSYLLFVAVLTCLGTFVFFNVLLEMRLPLGILAFGGRGW